MKKLSSLVLFTLVCVVIAKAQIEIGIVAGPSFTSFIGSEAKDWGGVDENPKMVVRFHGGLLLAYPFNDKLKGISGFQYSAKGTMYSGQPFTIKEEYKKILSYLDIPVSVQYAVSEKLGLQGGVQVSVLVSAKVKNNKESQDAYQLPATEDVKDYYNGIDMSLNLGAVYSLSEKLALQLLYQHGLMKIAQYAEFGADIDYAVMNQGVKLSVIYMIKQQ